MIKKTSILMLALLMAISLFAVGCGGSNDSENEGQTAEDTSLKDIQDKGTLVLGCDDQFPPMGFDDNGEVVGFDLDLAEAVCEKLGVKLEAKPIDWKTKELELSNGNVDVIWNGYSITAERNEKVEFTKPYLNNEQLIAVKADSDIKSKEDFKDQILGVQSDSAAEDVVNEDTELLESLGELKQYDTYQQAVLDLKGSDRIQGVAGDKVLLEYVMHQQPGVFKLLEGSLDSEYFGIGCRQGEVALREAIDKALDEMKEDGTTEKISKKWFDEDKVIRDVEKMTQEEIENN